MSGIIILLLAQFYVMKSYQIHQKWLYQQIRILLPLTLNCKVLISSWSINKVELCLKKIIEYTLFK